MHEEINAVTTKLPDFSQNEPLTWLRRAETRFRLRGTTQPTTKADYVLEAFPEEIFWRIGPWLVKQPDEIPYDDLMTYLLKEFSPTAFERARCMLMMPFQPMGDRKPLQLWDEICTLSRLLEVDDVSKQNKEVDLKKEIWLQSPLNSIRTLLHNTDDKTMDELSELADDITTSQNATHRHAVSTSAVPLPPTALNDIQIVRQNIKYTEQFHECLLPNGLCSYHKRFGHAARNCIQGCNWTQKNPEAVVSRENGCQRSTSPSLGS